MINIDARDRLHEEFPHQKTIEENSFDRFEFEIALFSVWNSIDDLNHVAEEVCNAGDEDAIMNMLGGIQALLNAKMQNVFEQFKRGVHSRKIV